nr:MAG TPA: hypothetical protein [Caudoviricetes sp.]
MSPLLPDSIARERPTLTCPHLDYTRLAVYNGSCERETLTVENSIVEGR